MRRPLIYGPNVASLVNGQTEFASVGVESGILDTQFTAAILMFCLPSLPPCSGDRDV
jgi:hypothetical protein